MKDLSRDQICMLTLFLVIDHIPHTPTTVTLPCQLIVVYIWLLTTKGRTVVLNDIGFGANHEEKVIDGKQHKIKYVLNLTALFVSTC